MRPSYEELHCRNLLKPATRHFCLDHTHIPAVRYPAGSNTTNRLPAQRALRIMQGETARVTFAIWLHSGPPYLCRQKHNRQSYEQRTKSTVVRIAASARASRHRLGLPLPSPACTSPCARQPISSSVPTSFSGSPQHPARQNLRREFSRCRSRPSAHLPSANTRKRSRSCFLSDRELFQDMAVVRSRKSIAALMDIRPDYANLKMPVENCTGSTG